MNVFHQFTLRTLRENRVRTLVTIIGIVLSAAMFTGVTTSVSSLQNYLVNLAIETSGNWHGVVYSAEKPQVDALQDHPDVKTYTSVQLIGYARLDGIQNEYKPYLWIGGMSENFAENMSIVLTSGRFPENPTEIILPRHLEINGGVSFALGDTISLLIGDRVVEGYVLSQNNPYMTGKDGATEELEVHSERTYTVVGTFERPTFEGFTAPGYTALTTAAESDPSQHDVYISLVRPNKIYDFMQENFPELGRSTNSNLLRFLGASNEDNFNAVIYGLAAVLLALILVGSVALIYNAFSISLSERTQQYGLLKSVGATRRQLTQGVLFEAFFLSLIGIPLGVVGGIAGIAITFKLAEDLFSALLRGLSGVVPSLYVSWGAILAAVLGGLVTVLISAYLPAKRALRLAPIDAIRQTSDIAVDPKKMKTSRLTLRLFGFEGMLARKNFNRNRKKYQATILSLIMSVVLFISASSFVAYIGRSATAVIQTADFDLIYYLMDSSAQKTDPHTLMEQLTSVGGVTGVGFISDYYEEVKVARGLIDPAYLDYLAREGAVNMLGSDEINVYMQLSFIDDRQYEEYVRQHSLVDALEQSTTLPTAIVLDTVRLYSAPEDRYYTFRLFNQDQFSLAFSRYRAIDGLSPWSRETDPEDGIEYYIYKNQEGEEVRFPADEAREDVLLSVGAVTDQRPPTFVSGASFPILIFPHSAMEAVVNRQSSDTTTALFFRAEDHKAAYEKMSAFLADRGLETVHLHDYAAGVEAERAMIAVVNIFSYGFIVLISLIAAANVFNTVSTNIGLRRREFAMLKSIGMTQKGFTKMMNYECLLYGFKALLYGLPVSVFVTYWIYQSILRGYEISFFVPWYSVAIAVGSVFLVVFATMIYSMSKIRRDNLIDALRNENL